MQPHVSHVAFAGALNLLYLLGSYPGANSDITPGSSDDDLYIKFIFAHHCTKPDTMVCCNERYNQEDNSLFSIRRTSVIDRSEWYQGIYSFDCVKLAAVAADRITRRRHVLICPYGSTIKAVKINMSKGIRRRLGLKKDEWIVRASCEGSAMDLQQARPWDQFAIRPRHLSLWHAVPLGTYPRDPEILLTRSTLR